MPRRLLIAALAALGGLALATPVAAAPTPTPTPARDTATVCHVTAETVKNGLQDFVAQMQQVETQSKQGDLQGAQTTVQQGGKRLVAIGTQLRVDASNAENAQLKATVARLADEFVALGNSLTSLTSLQSFDTAKLDSLANSMKSVCGGSFTPRPSAS